MRPLEISLTCDLVRIASPSLTSNVAVSQFVRTTLSSLGFETEWVEYVDAGGERKANVISRLGAGEGGIAFFAHTDTVPATAWARGNPWEPFEESGRIYGRGSCDMKGPLATMISAASRFSASQLRRPIHIVCTADEEIGYHGARAVADRSQLFAQMRQVRGIVGEPTRLDVVHGHKGTVLMTVTSRGRAAHSSTSLGVNANLKMIQFLAEMKAIHDELHIDPAHRNEEFDPPTPGWNIGINDHTAATNVTAPQSICTVYYRPMPGDDPSKLIGRVETSSARHGLEFALTRSSPPMYTDPQSDWVRQVLAIADRSRSTTVPYGTDGAVFGEHVPVVICGPGDIAQAHTVDEWIAIDQLAAGTELFARLIDRFCVADAG